MICLGDFFDKPTITDEQITAIHEIKWNNLPCKFLCGNHESSVADLRYNMLYALSGNNREVINTVKITDDGNCEIVYLPYITESDKKPLAEYFGQKGKKRIIISHNDIAGIMYGGYESQSGFSIKEIEENCDLYLNGHLHNSEWITKKILNVGSFSAHNFTNDSYRYKYGVWILDTDTSKISFIENPCGYTFYKIDIENEDDISKIFMLKKHAVLSIKCNEELIDDLKTALDDQKNWIEAYRIITVKTKVETTSTESTVTLLGEKDHIEKLKDFCKEKLNNTNILLQELAELSK